MDKSPVNFEIWSKIGPEKREELEARQALSAGMGLSQRESASVHKKNVTLQIGQKNGMSTAFLISFSVWRVI